MPTVNNTTGEVLTMPTKTKAVFKGYYDATSNGVQYYTSALASARTWDKTGAQTLYAVFADCRCTSDTGVKTCTASSVSGNKCTYDVTYEDGYYGAATQTNSNAGQEMYTATATACTNKPTSHSHYTGSASSNACPWSCDTGYTTTGKQNGTATGTESGKVCRAIDDYTITYTMNNGTNYSGAPTTYKYGVGATINGMPTRSEYTFTGWTGSNGTTAQLTVTIGTTATGNKTYTANWSKCDACNAGTGATCELTVESNTCTYTTNCLDGYHGITGNGTATPSCTPNTYKIHYDANATGATGSMTESTHTYDTPKALTANGFTNGTKKFLGWAKSSTATTATYTNAQEVLNLTTTNNGTVNLYAVWESCTACAPGTGAECTLTAPLGVCTYETNCLTGYSNLQNNGAHNPSCSADCNEITVNNTARGGSTANTKLYKYTDSTDWYTASTCSAASKVTTITRPSKTNATFTGYYTANKTTNVGSSASPSVLSTTWTVNAPTTIYAYYDCNQHYRTDGTDIAGACTSNQYLLTLTDSKVAANSTTAYEVYGVEWHSSQGLTITTVPGVNRANYTFRGWYTTDLADVTKNDDAGNVVGVRKMTGTVLPSSTTIITSDTTWYAAWARSCITPSNGSCDMTVKEDGTVEYVTTCNTGYTISGDGTYNPTCTPNTYTVSYTLRGGSHGGNNHPTSATYDIDFTVDNPTHAHGTFAGWTISGMDDVTHTFGSTTNTNTSVSGITATTFKNLRATSGTVTFTAVWTCANGYTGNNCTASVSTVTLNKNTSSNDTTTVATVSATFDAAMPSADVNANALTVPTRAKANNTTYTFNGYFDARTGGTMYYDKALASAHTWDKTGAQTLYAQWSMTCDAGYYLPKNTLACTPCLGGHYCTGGTEYVFNATTDQGITGKIKAGYYASGCAKTDTGTVCSNTYSGGQCTTDSTTGRPTYTDVAGGASRCEVCPAVTNALSSRVISYGYYPAVHGNGVNNCYANFTDSDSTATFHVLCYHGSGDYGDANSPCQVYAPTACAAGYGSIIANQTEWGSSFASVLGVDTMNGRVCGKCAAGSASAEGALTCTTCELGTYASAQGMAACAEADNGYYVSTTGATSQTQCPAGYRSGSDNGRDADTDCFVNTTAGNYVATPNAAQTSCAQNGYCTGGTKVYYGQTGGRALCSSLGGGLYSHSAAGSDEASDCYATVSGGEYIGNKTNTTFTTCDAGYKCPAGNVQWDSIGNRTACSGVNEWQDATGQTTCKSVTDGMYKKSDKELQKCGTGYFCKNGVRTACTTYGTGYTTTTETASVNTECFLTVSGGHVRHGTSGTTLDECVAGTYKADNHKEFYGTQYTCDDCTTRTKYSAAGASECSIVDAGYYTTGCTGDDNCTGQTYCTGTTYCVDGVQNECPNAYTYKRTTFPADYYDPTLTSTSVQNATARTAITECRVLSWLSNERGTLYEYAFYDTTTNKYDNRQSYGWSDVNAGYYLTTKGSCGSYAYYLKAEVCPSGSFCPGKSHVTCNPSNQATVHTENFGLQTCPTGYTSNDGATADTECYITVSGGHYIAEPGQNSTNWGTCAAGYAKAQHTVNYGSTSSCGACTGATYADTTGASSCTTCPAATMYASRIVGYGYYTQSGTHDTVSGCRATIAEQDPTGDYTLSCGLSSGDYGTGVNASSTACMAGNVTSCAAGKYAPYENPAANVKWASSVESMIGTVCVDVGTSYYSADGDLTRTQCTTGLVTTGTGLGADESCDCGRMLKFSNNNSLHLRSCQKTTPSMKFDYNKDGVADLFANMVPDVGTVIKMSAGMTKSFKATYGNQDYYICDDSSCSGTASAEDDSNAKFIITTTNMGANSVFNFDMSATGTFTVNCGTGGTLSGTGVSGNTITRSDTTSATYTCTYPNGGTKNIKFDGTATGYNTNAQNPVAAFKVHGTTDAGKVAAVSGSLGALMPTLGQSNGQQPRFAGTFTGCGNLTSVPAGLFSNVTGATDYMFSNTFSGCTGLTTVPAGLFSGVNGTAPNMFIATFLDCTGLETIPSGLFSGINGSSVGLFSYTFNGCSSLQSIPDNLFVGVGSAASSLFNRTFAGCSSLQSIPANLFANVQGIAGYLFHHTFEGCTTLTQIPGTLFSGVSGTNNAAFEATFKGCTGITSIPAGLFSGITGLYGSWGFQETFANCTSLTGYIPSTTFSGLVANGSPSGNNLTIWKDTFLNTQLATTCPTGTTPYSTGYESTWASYAGRAAVSCQ